MELSSDTGLSLFIVQGAQTLLNPLTLLLTAEFSPQLVLTSHYLLLSSSHSNQFPPSTSYMVPPPLCLSTATRGAGWGKTDVPIL